MNIEFVRVFSITVICLFVGFACKKFEKIKDEYIPVIVGLLGGVLGVAGMFIIPEYPASNIMDAVAVGIMNGLTAVGVHQIGKQLDLISFFQKEGKDDK